MKTKLSEFLFQTLLLTSGSALCALAVNGILIPHNFLSSGLTGVALVIYYKAPVLSVATLYLLINIPIFVLGWFYVGLRFVLYSAWGMLMYSLMLYFLTFNMGIPDKMLATFVAGAMTGVGIAIMLKSYGSAGGSEILYVISNKLFSMSIGTGTILLNGTVLGVALFLFPLVSVLYTLVFIGVSAFFTDKVFHGSTTRQAVLIISEKWSDIVDEMTQGNRLSVTLIKGRGGYKGSERTILYSVINRKNVHSLKRLVTHKDPNAFMAIMDAADVIGEHVGNQPHW